MPGRAEPHVQPKIERYVLEGFEVGLVSEASLSKTLIPDSACTCASNIEFWPPGTISKRPGRTYKNEQEPLSGAITQIYQWWTEAGTNYIMCFQAASGAACSAQVYYMEPATQTSANWTAILTSGQEAWNPDATQAIMVESFGGSALFVNGVDRLHEWNGTGKAYTITEAPTGAVCIRGYKNYLFLANAQDSAGVRHNSRVWWSDPGDAHTWPAANYMDLDGDDGDLITGMEILGNELIIFKERKIFAVTYVGGQYTFYAENRAMGVGCAAGASIIPIFSELLFYGIENFYSFTGRDVESMGDKIKDLITYQIIAEYRSSMRGITYEEKNQVWWPVAMDADETYNSHILVMDYTRDAWTMFAAPTASLAWYVQSDDLTFGDFDDSYSDINLAWGSRLFLSNSTIILAGTYDGYVVDHGTAGSMSDLGSDYTGLWRSRWLDFGMPDINKRITRITVLLDKEVESAEDAYNINLNIYKDWDPDVLTTKTLSVYGTYPVLERRVDFTMTCRAMQLEFESDTKGQAFTIHKVIIEYIPKGRTLVV